MSKGDELIEKGAVRLEDLSRKAAERGGFGETLSGELAEDAAFLRKLKPSLVRARMRGEAPTDQKPGERPAAPTGPQIPKRPKPPGGGPNPWIVVGAALAAGIMLAKLIDWRGHAHPRL